MVSPEPTGAADNGALTGAVLLVLIVAVTIFNMQCIFCGTPRPAAHAPVLAYTAPLATGKRMR